MPHLKGDYAHRRSKVWECVSDGHQRTAFLLFAQLLQVSLHLHMHMGQGDGLTCIALTPKELGASRV